MRQKKHLKGFSLTELSAAIAIIAVIAGSAISVAITSDDAAKKTQTISKLDAIEEALGAYLAIHKRLPCPAEPEWASTPANFAIENASGDPLTCAGTGGFNINPSGSIVVRYGALPVLTLQLPAEYYKDGWGRPFTYVVDTRFVNNTNTNTTPCDGSGAADSDENSCFLYATTPAIEVYDEAGQERTSLEKAVVVVFSHGANGHGAYFANGAAGRYAAKDGRTRSSSANPEWENSHLTTTGTSSTPDEIFIQRDFIKSEAVSGVIFDDMLRFLGRQQLVNKTGATLFQEECVTAQTVLNNPGSNDCTSATNAPLCEKFAQEIDDLCLQ